jgi:predicted phosphodiesterase
MFKFLHTADLHLDSPQLNLDQYDGAPVAWRNPTRQAFDNLVGLAISEQVQFVLIAGDLYDGDCRNFHTPLHFRRKMHGLREHGIQVFIVQGNHDAESRMQKAFSLELPDNVHMFSTHRAGTARIDDLQVAIHGQGFATRDVQEDLSAGYPEAARGWLNIGLLHTSCGSYDAHARYAPSTIAGLTQKGYDYWALGHIHKREQLAGPEPWIVYPGNPQGRHVREIGPRGCVIASVEADRITEVRWHDVDILRWQVCFVDATQCPDPDAVLGEAETAVQCLLDAADDRPLAVRVEIHGASHAHRSLICHADYWHRRLQEGMLNRFDDRVWIEQIKLRTRAAVDLATWSADDPTYQLLQGIADSDSFAAALAEVGADYEQLLRLLPADPRLTESAWSLDDPRWQQPDLAAEVQQLLIGSLLQSGAP